MLAIQFSRTGGPEVLEVVDKPTPVPGPQQLLVRNKAIGLNFVDTYFRSGLYPLKLPSAVGTEAAGVVEAVGAEVSGWKPGDRVGYAGGAHGSYAEYHVVAADRALRLPDGVSDEVAAAAMLKGMTAECLLLRCVPVRAGDAIVIHAAAGGVGSIMVQWARAIGCFIIATAGSEAKAQMAKDYGADHVILYDREDVAARVKELTGGKGVRVVYDSVGAATFEGSLSSLARRGTLVSFGNASGPPPAVEPRRLQTGGSLFLTRPGMADYNASAEELQASAAALFGVIASGAVKIQIGQTFALRDAAKAHAALESRQTSGSTVLIP